MDRLRRICLSAVLLTTAAGAQTPAGAVASAAVKPPSEPWRQKTVSFSRTKPLVGLPDQRWIGSARCSTDGVTYFNFLGSMMSEGVYSPPELYSVSESGEVKHLPRTLPKDFSISRVRDFFAAEHTLVTLIEAVKHEGEGRAAETAYFISVSDHDGDQASVVRLDLKFKPLKVALFATGDYLVLGWDEANLLPVLALVKEDGTVRRFMDLDRGTAGEAPETRETYSSVREVTYSARSMAAVKMLQNAVFVPFDSQVLLAYTATTRSLRVISSLGEDRSIPLGLPPGFLLHDVMVSGVRGPVVVRAQSAADYEALAKKHIVENPKQRVFEVDSFHGGVIRELVFDKPHPQAVTCAAHMKLTAIFDEPLPDVAKPANGAGDGAEAEGGEVPSQKVMASVPR